MPHQAAPKFSAALEANRLSALASYGVLDTPRESMFDDIVLIASAVCDTPMALISLVDSDRQWFKAEIGLNASQTPLESSICAHAILQDDVLVVPDTTLDERFVGNPLVSGNPKLRFYAGALLKTADGLPLGTVCVLDTISRNITNTQRETLRALARQVMVQLELRKMLVTAQSENQNRARLLASVGHDFKAPLRSSLYSIARAKQGASLEQLTRLESAENELHSIDQSFNRMIGAASGKSTFTINDLVDVDLGALMELMRITWASRADRAGVQLKVVRTRLQVRSHSGMLETLLGNVVANAVKYTARDGRVLIGCRRSGEFVEVDVLDTGIGMPSEKIDDMFGAFHQADAKSEGLGLGLWIARQTAEALGIEVKVQSRVGHGTRVSLRIPASNAAPNLL